MLVPCRQNVTNFFSQTLSELLLNYLIILLSVKINFCNTQPLGNYFIIIFSGCSKETLQEFHSHSSDKGRELK